MENVVGGWTDGEKGYLLPDSHEEIDKIWDAIEAAQKVYGDDVAFVLAVKLRAFASDEKQFITHSPSFYRDYMHRRFDGKLSTLDHYQCH